MTRIERFEDIDAWKKARELARAIYAISAEGPFSRDFGLRDQIRRASVSIMSNIAAGLGCGGNREFIQFLSMAKGSVKARCRRCRPNSMSPWTLDLHPLAF